jgi:hypothetical protein
MGTFVHAFLYTDELDRIKRKHEIKRATSISCINMVYISDRLAVDTSTTTTSVIATTATTKYYDYYDCYYNDYYDDY